MLKSILLLFSFLVLGFVVAVALVYWHIIPGKSTVYNLIKPVSTATQFSIANAPSATIRGEISSISGSIQWESRVATEPATITLPQTIQQGEEVITGKDGKATIEFPKIGTIQLQANTDLSIIQTLPADIVIAQNSGSADYTKTGKSPLTIRSLDTIIDITSGESKVTIPSTLPRVTALVEQGSITAAFNDSNSVSTVMTATIGQQFIFDEGTKTGNVE